MSTALRAALPPPPNSVFIAKLEHFSRHWDEYDTIFLGSSHVYRHLDPARFDAIMASGGHPTRSLNLGVQALSALEARYLLDLIASHPPTALRTLFIGPLENTLDSAGNLESHRVRFWHTPSLTLKVCRLILDTNVTPARKLELLDQHGRLFLARTTNEGRLRSVLEPWITGTDESRHLDREHQRVATEAWIGNQNNGFQSLDDAFLTATGDERARLERRRKHWQESRLSFPDLVESWRGERMVTELSETDRRLVDLLVNASVPDGVEMIFITHPTPKRPDETRLDLLAAEREKMIPALLDLGDPDRHLDLYDPDLRFDLAHLNVRGATMLTDALARDFLDYLKRSE